jgi:hypothetical protein
MNRRRGSMMEFSMPILPASIVGDRPRLPLIVVHVSRPPNRSRDGVTMGLRLARRAATTGAEIRNQT